MNSSTCHCGLSLHRAARRTARAADFIIRRRAHRRGDTHPDVGIIIAHGAEMADVKRSRCVSPTLDQPGSQKSPKPSPSKASPIRHETSARKRRVSNESMEGCPMIVPEEKPSPRKMRIDVREQEKESIVDCHMISSSDGFTVMPLCSIRHLSACPPPSFCC